MIIVPVLIAERNSSQKSFNFLSKNRFSFCIFDYIRLKYCESQIGNSGFAFYDFKNVKTLENE